MSQIKAVYRHGVFEPLQPVDLAEEQQVRVSVEAMEDQSPQSWLVQVRAMQAAIIGRGGPLPDSASEIAADRTR